MKHVIGFAKKHYTYWRVSDPYSVVHNDYETIKIDYEYVQNLSFDRSTAVEKIKKLGGDDYEIDLKLNADKSFTREVEKRHLDETFILGRYSGMKFEDVDDNDYKSWYYFQVKDTDHDSKRLHVHLADLGLLIEYDGELISLFDLKDEVTSIFDKYVYKDGLFGNDKEDVSLKLRFRSKTPFKTQFGEQFIYRFVDDSKHELYYFNGVIQDDIEVNTTYAVTGKIRHFKQYSAYHKKNIEQTFINRLKIIETQ